MSKNKKEEKKEKLKCQKCGVEVLRWRNSEKSEIINVEPVLRKIDDLLVCAPCEYEILAEKYEKREMPRFARLHRDHAAELRKFDEKQRKELLKDPEVVFID